MVFNHEGHPETCEFIETRTVKKHKSIFSRNAGGSPDLVQVDLRNVNTVIQKLFPGFIPQAPLAERIAYFIQNWEKLPQNPNILQTVQ